MRGAGEDVLPAIRLEELLCQTIGLGTAHGPAAGGSEVGRIRARLHLQDAVDGADQGDEVVYGAVAVGRRQRGIVALQLQLVEHNVLALAFQWKRNTSLNSADSSPSGSMLWR